MKIVVLYIAIFCILNGYVLSEIIRNLNLSKDLKIKKGRSVMLINNSKIKSKTNKKITIKSGGTLKIHTNADVTIDCPIEIEDGGKFVFEDKALARVDKIIVKKGGNIVGNKLTPENLNITLNNEAIILPAEGKSGKIILESEAELIIDNSEMSGTPPVKQLPVKPVAIVGGIELKQGTVLMNYIPPLVTPTKFTIKEKSKVDLGKFYSEGSTLIEFEKGSEVTLLTNSDDLAKPEYEKGTVVNNVNGRLVIGGDDANSIATVKGLDADRDYRCDDYGNDNFVLATISMITSAGNETAFLPISGENYSSSVSLKNTDFRNVTFKMVNVAKAPLTNCNFTIDGAKVTAYFENSNFHKPNSIIEAVWNPGPMPQSPDDEYSLVNSLHLVNCTFKDNQPVNMPWLTYDKENPPPNDPEYQAFLKQFKYHFNGIYASGFKNVTVDNSGILPNFAPNEIPTDLTKHHFIGLNSAVSTVNCSRVTITHTNMANSRIGSDDQSSHVKMCQNVTYRVNTPHSLNNSGFWSTIDNHFYQSNKATGLIGVLSGQNFRGNFFNDYYNGIFMSYSRAHLVRQEADQISDIISQLGTNEFAILAPIASNEYSEQYYPIGNPFCTSSKFNPINGERTDFFFKNYPSLTEFENRKPLKIQCGKNRLGEYTPSHLFYDKEGNPQLPNIVVVPNVNWWRPSQVIRYNLNGTNNITIAQPDNDLFSSIERIPGCDEPVLTESCFGGFVPIYNSCDFFPRNIGTWPYLSETDSVLDNDFYSYLNDFCNGILSCECYRQRLFDLMQLAVLGDSSDSKLQMVIDCILEKATDPAYSICNIRDLLLLLGEAYERRGLMDEALDAYYDLIFNPGNSADTTLARWRIMNIEAMQADTTFGALYDSLMTMYLERMNRDISQTYSGSQGGGSNPPPPRIAVGNNTENINAYEILPIAELEQNQPNPFTNETMIKFRLNYEADVRLGIHDNLGHTIRVITNQHLKKGNYQYTFINDGLGAGVYLYLLTTDGRQFTKRMQLVK